MSADSQLALASESYPHALDLFDPSRYEHAMTVAKQIAQSQLVPAAFKGNVPNCFLALEVAGRMRASPFMVMQNMNIIHGKPSWGSSFIIAMINASGRFSPLRYRYTGTQLTDGRTCVAYATSKIDDEPLEGTGCSILMAKKQGWWGKDGSKWPDMSELMLMYRAATFFGRMYAPDMLMGMQSAEEVWDVDPVVTPGATDVPRGEGSTQADPKKFRNKGVAGMKTAEKVEPESTPAGNTSNPPVTEVKKDEKAPVQQEKPAEKTVAPTPEPEKQAPAAEEEETPPMDSPPPAPVGHLCEIAGIVEVKANTARGFALKVDLTGPELACSGFLDRELKDTPKMGTKVRAVVDRREHPTKPGTYNNFITSLVAV